MNTWLSANTVWILLVIAPGGLDSQIGVYATQAECVSAQRAYEALQPLRAECKETQR